CYQAFRRPSERLTLLVLRKPGAARRSCEPGSLTINVPVEDADTPHRGCARCACSPPWGPSYSGKPERCSTEAADARSVPAPWRGRVVYVWGITSGLLGASLAR